MASEVAFLKAEDLPPLHSPHCFPVEKPSEDLVKNFERNNKQFTLDPATTTSRGLDWLAARIVGTEAEPLQGFFVSRAGVEVSTGRALIYAEKRAALAGFGAFFLLEKKGEWKVIDACVTWES